jgi:hypothetical protein
VIRESETGKSVPKHVPNSANLIRDNLILLPRKPRKNRLFAGILVLS